VSETANAFSATYAYGDAGRFTHASEAAAPLPGSDVKPRDVEYQYAGVDPEQVTALVDGSGTYASYTYDLAGNQTRRTFSTTGESWDYVYDGENRLRRVTRKLNGTVTGSEEYWYDSAGNRNHVVKRDVAGNKTEMIWFMRDDVEAHYDANGTVTKVYGHVTMGTPVFRLERNTDAGATVEYQFHGIASNTLAAVDQATGTVNASFTYAPFGEIIEATNAGGSAAGIDKHRRRMNDKYVDEIGGLAYYGFRYYDKMAMTWTQSDPLYRFSPEAAWTRPGQALLYKMSLNNPLRYRDPDGQSTLTLEGFGMALGEKGAELLAGVSVGTVALAIVPVAGAALTVALTVKLGLDDPAAVTRGGVSVYGSADVINWFQSQQAAKKEAQRAQYQKTLDAFNEGVAKARSEAMKAENNALSKDKAPAKSAEIHPGKGDQAGEDLSLEDAVECVRCGNDVIAKDKKTARDIATKAGKGPPDHDDRHRPNERPHYHPTDENGNRIDDAGHVMY
jgi:RHS repeat-associated protein